MLLLDDEFFAHVGLADMPAQDRGAFLDHVRESLEDRVGGALAEGLSDAQMDEFGALMDGDGERIAAWLDVYAPDFLTDPVYVQRAEQIGDHATPTEIVCEYATAKWLEINRPDHRDVVSAVLEELAAEIRKQSAAILATYR